MQRADHLNRRKYLNGKAPFDTYSMLVGALAIMMCGWPTNAPAQVNTAEITGTITDTQGDVIPGATITVKNLGTGSIRKGVSSSLGSYTIPLLPVDTYAVTVEKEGFKSVTIPQVTLSAGDRLKEDIQLEVGQLTQTIEVVAQTPALQTQNANLSTLVNPHATEDLPLNGRNVQGLTLLVPGSNAGLPNDLPSGNRPDDRRPTSSVSINAEPSNQNNFLLDGVDDNERFIGTIMVKPQIDALREVKIESNNFPASVSRTGGGVIDLVTKSGTDQFHGSLYEFLRNDNLDARNFFDKSIPSFHQNQFGASLGGPVKRGRTFFFGDYEGLRIVKGLTDLDTVPTAAERVGDFEGISRVFNPFTGVPDPTNPNLIIRTEYPGDQLTNLDPIAVKLVSLYPLPNRPGLVNNFIFNPTKIQNGNSFDARVDHTFSPNNNFFARYSFNNFFTNLPDLLPTVNGIAPGGNLFGFFGPSRERAQNAILGYLHVFSPNLVVDSRASFMRFRIETTPPNFGKNVSQQFGIPGANIDSDSSGLTPFSIPGFTGLGDSDFIPIKTTNNSYEFASNWSYTKSSHNMEFGVRYERRQLSPFQSPQSRGEFDFDSSFTNDPTGTVANSGNAFADFLLGIPSSTRRAKYLIEPGLRLNEWGAYFQDSWKVIKTLTLNLGLRWDYYPPLSETFNRISNVDLATGKIIIAGQQGVSGSAGVPNHYDDFEPRFGFAKMFGQQTVLRGGYGISFNPQFIGSTFALRNPPFVSLFTVTTTPLTPVNTIDQGFPLPVPTSVSNPTGSLSAVALNYENQYTQQYNLTLQRKQFGLVFGASYVGELVRHAIISGDINQAPPGPGPIGPRRPFHVDFPNIASIGYAESAGTGRYNALQISVERRYAAGLSVLANYTYAHAINDFTQLGGGGNGEASPELFNDLSLERGNGELDIRHRATIAVVYDLPFGKNLSGWRALLGGGWQFNTIFTAQTGFPFTITNASARSNTGDGDRPNLVGNPHLSNPTVNEWFNVAAFAPQPLFTIGNVGRNTLFGPSLNELDVSFLKNFRVSEKFTLQFRTEIFNIFNHPNFGLPGSALGAGNFGVISNTANNESRQIQFALKLLF